MTEESRPMQGYRLTGLRTKRAGLMLVSTILVFICVWLLFPRRPKTAIIELSEVRQTIDGFGGSSADFLTGLTPAQADFFFTPNGIGLSILRVQIIPDTTTCNAEFHYGGCSDSNGQILNGELSTAKMAVDRGATVMATPWSPPAAYKSNNSFKNGGSLLPSHYYDWASDIASFVAMMKKNGVPIYAVSVQNEPNLSTEYGSCRYSAQQIHDFIPYLYKALQENAAESTKIMVAEQSQWAFDLASAAMADPKVASEVGIVAAHGYYRSKARPFPAAGSHLWQTEDSSESNTYDGSMDDAIKWAVTIHKYLANANVNAWLWWFLSDMPHQGEGTDNAALTDISGNIPKRAYALGQWSKFVRPGWSRIDVKYSGPLAITAFKSPDGHAFAIVAVNSSDKSVAQTFELNGSSSSQITPWITSNRWSLTPQPPVSVNGTTFSYTLPGSSVATFSGVVAQVNNNGSGR